jgi:hypothetical protein
LGKRAYEGQDVEDQLAKKHKPDEPEGGPTPLEGVRATNAEKKARTRKQKRALAAKMNDDDPKVSHPRPVHCLSSWPHRFASNTRTGYLPSPYWKYWTTIAARAYSNCKW